MFFLYDGGMKPVDPNWLFKRHNAKAQPAFEVTELALGWFFDGNSFMPQGHKFRKSCGATFVAPQAQLSFMGGLG
jgi:hypothetical protein